MRIAAILTGAFLLDQITKIIVRNTMYLGQSIPILGNFAKFTYVENPGMAFGLQIGNGTIFTILSILAMIGIAYYLFVIVKDDAKTQIPLALILGGALGNLIDRILYSRVVDFMDIGLKTVRWPVFNVADSVVVIGMFILAWQMIFQKPDQAVEKTISITENESSQDIDVRE